MSLLESLRFTRGDTIIHKLDPRVKFLMTLVFFSISADFTLTLRIPFASTVL